jgi:hypothetical protein
VIRASTVANCQSVDFDSKNFGFSKSPELIARLNTLFDMKKYKVFNRALKETWLDALKDKGKHQIINPADFVKNIDKTSVVT